MTENSRITAQSKRIVRLLTMNRDEQRHRLGAEAERDRLRELVRSAYDEGRIDATYTDGTWEESETRAALAKEKE